LRMLSGISTGSRSRMLVLVGVLTFDGGREFDVRER
jgi:hypothetical protein